MADVRLTATNPADSSVVPVACNSKGELLVDKPVIEQIDNDVTFGGDVEISGELSVSGSAFFQTSSFSGDANFTKDVLINELTVGHGPGNSTENTVVGKSALRSNADGAYNTAIGQTVLLANTSGSSNTAVGSAALSKNISGSNNTAVGRRTLVDNTEGTDNSAVGLYALKGNTTGNYNTAIGVSALSSSTTGSFNTAVGRRALYITTEASYNTAVGRDALSSITTAVRNTAVGHNAGLQLTGESNTFIGNYQGISGISNTVSLSSGADERMRISADDTVDFNQKCGFTSDGGIWMTDTRGNTYRTTFASNNLMQWEPMTIKRRNEPQLTDAEIEAKANS